MLAFEHNPAAQGKIAMPASWYLLTAHSSCIKQPIKHHAPRSLGLQRCSQYPACPHSQPRSSVPSLLQPASSPASSGGSRWSGALRPAGSTFAGARAVAGAWAVAGESFLAARCRTYLVAEEQKLTALLRLVLPRTCKAAAGIAASCHQE